MDSRRRSVTWRIAAERLTVLGWGRAILMQLAHPLVAAGVADHSAFADARHAPLLRLHGTIRAMLDLSFGNDRVVRAAAEHINRIHDGVHGHLRSPIGVFPAGTRYSAHDPTLLAWVHATLVESIEMAYERFVGPLSRQDRNDHCRETRDVSELLGVPSELMPSTADELQAYVMDTLASGVLAVGDEARALAYRVLHPPWRRAYWPASRLHYLATVGLLPPPLRVEYELAWTEADAVALDRWSNGVRRGRRVMPEWLATWARSRRAPPQSHNQAAPRTPLASP